ncbi:MULTISPECIES: EAL domain-containing protein [unclassified Agarivorans]|uniref:EAL domain-containing protein n=1 Tax=unclassified Agarivorans TaxID=2636026 RepID=UPI0026E179AF|nr:MULTISPECIES: GGDEF domain-containing protein [unclassified Agarivorans]MDO6688111.1 GGDEF domain-containing protein [Agarivorans sp. 3_MG-2023]MDO6717686.1 GGDEF domain-containing protein [Agarivorans sp. 2_MG-2023]
MKGLRTFFVVNAFLFIALWISLVGVHVQLFKLDLARENQQINTLLALQLTKVSQLNQDYLSGLRDQHNLSFISTQLAVDNTLATVGSAQHWLVDLAEPSKTAMQTLAVDKFSVNFKPSFEFVSDGYLKLYLTIAALCFMGYFLTSLLYLRAISRVKSKLKKLVNADRLVDEKPVLGSVGELIKDQKQQFTQQIRQQKHAIKQLEKQVALDPLTGQFNRHSFRQKMQEMLQSESKNTVLFLVRASQLEEINKSRGHQAGDDYIREIARIIDLNRKDYSSSLLYRLLGAEFALIIPNFAASRVSQIALALKSSLSDYSSNKQMQSAAYTGVTELKQGDSIERIIARADAALAIAQSLSPNGWEIVLEDNETLESSELQWHTTISRLINHANFRLASQAIQSLHRTMPAYHEVFIRFLSEKQQQLPTETTLVMAQRLGVIVELEKATLRYILKTISSQNAEYRWGINLSKLILNDPEFCGWLTQELLTYPNLKSRVVFEIEEELLDMHLTNAKKLFEVLRRNSCHTAIADFGNGIGSFKLFKELKPNYVKISSDLVQQLETDKANQQFVTMLVEVSHRLGCQVIAQGVETLEQKQLLESMYVDSLQGYLIARPELIS